MSHPPEWVLSVDGASNMKGIGTRITLEGLGNIFIDQALMFEFKANKNQAKYEALIVGMVIALEMETSKLKAKNDSQLASKQVSGKYHTK